ncbi:MAG: HD domain-containing protein [Chthoniobacteraceae bacterium]|jgi:(p)ppGpp synthase/HD superfamily hydrolase
MTSLEKAIEIAVRAHAGQKGKDGTPYVLHPLRLMTRMGTDEERMAAVLHDVVEDTEVTFQDLRAAGIPEPVLEAAKLLTHEEGISYEDYVERLKPHPVARKVKLADLEDNSDIRRLSGIEEKDLQRLRKYHRAWQILRPTVGEAP